ncbi:MAG TPA: hypothetical protein VLG50_05655 [Candidatus Saccharimonadales bacterium]|nr:hypothetical protein [Candidatus Saccharimonadales bacterium]
MEPKLDYEKYSTIKHVVLWKNQRDLNQNLVDTIVKDQLDYGKKYGLFTFPGILVVVRWDNKDYLIDGQHRFNALHTLYTKHKYDIKVAIQLYQCKEEEQIDSLYSMLNHINSNNCMVKDGQIDPDGAKLREIKTLLKQSYKSKIWDDQKVTKPYVNTKLLDQELKTSLFFQTKTTIDIVNKIKEQNDHYALVLKDQNLQEYKKMMELGGFVLQCKEPKAKWVRCLF